MLGETANGAPVDANDVDDWVSIHGITHPVVADPGHAYGAKLFDNPLLTSLPSMTLLDAGEILEKDNYLTVSMLENRLQ